MVQRLKNGTTALKGGSVAAGHSMTVLAHTKNTVNGRGRGDAMNRSVDAQATLEVKTALSNVFKGYDGTAVVPFKYRLSPHEVQTFAATSTNSSAASSGRSSLDASPRLTPPRKVFRCPRCQTPLARATQIHSHVASCFKAQGPAPDKKKKESKSESASPEQSLRRVRACVAKLGLRKRIQIMEALHRMSKTTDLSQAQLDAQVMKWLYEAKISPAEMAATGSHGPKRKRKKRHVRRRSQSLGMFAYHPYSSNNVYLAQLSRSPAPLSGQSTPRPAKVVTALTSKDGVMTPLPPGGGRPRSNTNPSSMLLTEAISQALTQEPTYRINNFTQSPLSSHPPSPIPIFPQYPAVTPSLTPLTSESNSDAGSACVDLSDEYKLLRVTATHAARGTGSGPMHLAATADGFLKRQPPSPMLLATGGSPLFAARADDDVPDLRSMDLSLSPLTFGRDAGSAGAEARSPAKASLLAITEDAFSQGF